MSSAGRHAAGRAALVAPQDQGSLRGGLLAMIVDDHRIMQGEGGVVLGIAFTARHDAELGAALGRRLDHESRARFEVLVDRAVAVVSSLCARTPPWSVTFSTPSSSALCCAARSRLMWRSSPASWMCCSCLPCSRRDLFGR